MIDLINLIGYIAGITQTVRTVPQIYFSVKTGSTKDLSFLMVVLSVIGTLLWLVYGIFTRSMPIVYTDSVGLLLLLSLLFIKIKFDKIKLLKGGTG
jgi:MtN3 and saliva related transmembrane protein